ncbi:uncharacterized protein AMSG_09993 [Thecamonas trahens ATCC 50062]|uniref:Uncharacterized protein n=1 Tax=Thecamonas trahens ATCC 50062 TaxID=461836 RepID=A0A0L0DRZ3_THETB|nr:hypothetical protein AMSG_09993 [Thecamonas trahens ATCC 50062]KNC54203.1 hypothetical protein AMSG_09993 [Thecamonas trahens ATCC 50062]|eukprot:XP_013753843.1 hypothetical protein AMSG_09993 [Thecamonas trahens ATCC 50062]
MLTTPHLLLVYSWMQALEFSSQCPMCRTQVARSRLVKLYLSGLVSGLDDDDGNTTGVSGAGANDGEIGLLQGRLHLLRERLEEAASRCRAAEAARDDAVVARDKEHQAARKVKSEVKKLKAKMVEIDGAYKAAVSALDQRAQQLSQARTELRSALNEAERYKIKATLAELFSGDEPISDSHRDTLRAQAITVLNEATDRGFSGVKNAALQVVEMVIDDRLDLINENKRRLLSLKHAQADLEDMEKRKRKYQAAALRLRDDVARLRSERDSERRRVAELESELRSARESRSHDSALQARIAALEEKMGTSPTLVRKRKREHDKAEFIVIADDDEAGRTGGRRPSAAGPAVPAAARLQIVKPNHERQRKPGALSSEFLHSALVGPPQALARKRGSMLGRSMDFATIDPVPDMTWKSQQPPLKKGRRSSGSRSRTTTAAAPLTAFWS